jgi:murein DD-endopeptidase MepM/ murein hydrolase activator NlpD
MRPADLDYMRQLRPPAIRVFEPDGNKMQMAHQANPDALLFPRDWQRSEQHDDVRSNPQGTGQRHAREWRATIDRWRAAGHSLPPDNRIVVVGINEPRVWDMLPQTVLYNVAWLDECTRLGLRACALNLSVGWPANNAPGEAPDWKPYAPIEAAIKRGNHYLCLHEYWYKSGPQDNWGWWAGRVQHCPWDVPIVIGECGIDLYVDMPRWEKDGKPARGWQGNVSQSVYAEQLNAYSRRLDTRIVAMFPFLTDYYDNRWASFDTAGAHQQLLSVAGSMVPQAKPPTGTKPPPVKPQPPIGEKPPPLPAGELVHPLPGAVITQHFGENGEDYARFGAYGHNGVDLAGMAEGTPVLSIAEGEVAWSDSDPDYGNYVRAYYPRLGCHAFFAHLSEPGAAKGTKLNAGDKVGNVGNTGNSTSAHLHLEIRLSDSDGGYKQGTPMSRGRVCPESWAIMQGLKL